MTEDKIQEIIKDIQKEMNKLLSFHDLELNQVTANFGEGIDTIFKLECNHIPKNDNDYYLPTTSEFKEGTAALPAFGVIKEENNNPEKVKVLSKKRSRYKIQKLNSDDIFTVSFENVFEIQ
jgi:hypothetical protein